MAQSAVLVGRTNADIGNNVLVLIVMSLTGLLVGWRIHIVFEAPRGLRLLLVFAYAISWVMAMIGLLVKSPEVVNKRQLHRDLPADVHRQHVRADRELPGRSRPSPTGTRCPSVTQAVRELFGNEVLRCRRLAAAKPGALHPDLVGDHPADLHPVDQSAVQAGDGPVAPGPIYG